MCLKRGGEGGLKGRSRAVAKAITPVGKRFGGNILAGAYRLEGRWGRTDVVRMADRDAKRGWGVTPPSAPSSALPAPELPSTCA